MAVTDAPIITAEEPGKPGVPIFSLPESTGLPCKGGCGDRVVTHKGIGGWCTKNGCRQKEIDRRKAEGTWNVSSHSRQPKRKKKSKRLVSDATKVALPKLDEITFKSLAHMENQIKIACARVREAEDELGTRRNDLKAILEAAAKYA